MKIELFPPMPLKDLQEEWGAFLEMVARNLAQECFPAIGRYVLTAINKEQDARVYNKVLSKRDLSQEECVRLAFTVLNNLAESQEAWWDAHYYIGILSPEETSQEDLPFSIPALQEKALWHYERISALYHQTLMDTLALAEMHHIAIQVKQPISDFAKKLNEKHERMQKEESK